VIKSFRKKTFKNKTSFILLTRSNNSFWRRGNKLKLDRAMTHS